MLIQSIVHSATFKNLFFSCLYQIVIEELSIFLRIMFIFDRLGTVMGSVIQATGSLELEDDFRKGIQLVLGIRQSACSTLWVKDGRALRLT